MENRKVGAAYVVRSSIFGVAGLVALIFIPAGTLHYWQGWAYVATWVISGSAYTAYIAKHDPALLKRRSETGISYEKERAQKIIVFFLFGAFIALMILPPLDFRFGWSNVPWYVSAFGDALIAASFYIFYLVSKANTYAAGNIRVEEGQKVISSGMYGSVRHPMYLGALILIAGTPLALGSWWSLLLIPLFWLILYFRIANEEKVLARDLQGYAEYMCKVRCRLMPHIW